MYEAFLRPSSSRLVWPTLQNAGERHTRRGALLQHLLATMRELGINYSICTQEIRLGGRLEGFGKA